MRSIMGMWHEKTRSVTKQIEVINTRTTNDSERHEHDCEYFMNFTAASTRIHNGALVELIV